MAIHTSSETVNLNSFFLSRLFLNFLKMVPGLSARYKSIVDKTRQDMICAYDDFDKKKKKTQQFRNVFSIFILLIWLRKHIFDAEVIPKNGLECCVSGCRTHRLPSSKVKGKCPQVTQICQLGHFEF